jgi:hypothetical protein
MKQRLKNSVRRVPGLLRKIRRSRGRARRMVLALAERRISAAPDHEILVVFGMRRSGNHVAINWILNQIGGTAAFYNNITPTEPPYSARMSEFRLRPGRAGPRIVLSYEDVTPQDMLAGPLGDYLAARAAQNGAGGGAGVRFALVLRDPYNLFASRLQKWPERFADPDQIKAQIQLYTQLAALAESPRPIWRDAPLVPVLYNDLLSDADARARIATALGIRPGNRGLDHVPAYGHGSSFDGTGMSGDAMRGHVFDRWRALQDDPVFRTILSNPDLHRIGTRLFPMSLPDLTPRS